MVKNTADTQQVRKAKQSEKARLERERADLHSVLSSVQGRRLLHRVIDASGLNRLSLVIGEEDNTAFREGRRSIGVALREAILSIDVRLYHLMEAEAMELEHIYSTHEQEIDHGRDAHSHADTDTDTDAS